jgi:predicted small lipoprotein YifL
MRRDATARFVILAAALAALGGCGREGPKAPGREVVTPLLQQEAAVLKQDGENFDPALRMKATWALVGIDVTERPNDPDRPWAGTIRFKIRSEMRDEQGAIVAKESERRFDYLWSMSLSRWIFQLPPSPAP